MPDQFGMLSQEERSAILDHLRHKTKGIPTCPVCGSTEWSLEPAVVSPVAIGLKDGKSVMMMGGAFLPQVMLISKCGFVRYFSAKDVGVLI